MGLLTRRRVRNKWLTSSVLHAFDSGDFDHQSVDAFWGWQTDGCPTDSTALQDNYLVSHLAEAATTEDVSRIAAFACSPEPWLRFAVATNTATPAHVIWGNGITQGGLVDDHIRWVRAAAVLNVPVVPAAMLDAASAEAEGLNLAGHADG